MKKGMAILMAASAAILFATFNASADNMQVKGKDAANLILKVEPDDPATSPALGAVQWYGKNDQGDPVLYIMLNSEIQDAGQETGALQFKAKNGAAMDTILEISRDGARVTSGSFSIGDLASATSFTLPLDRGNLGQFLKQGDDGQMIWGDVESINWLSDVDDVTTAGLSDGWGIKWNSTTAKWEAALMSTGSEVTAASVIADNSLVRGDGGGRGVKDSDVTLDDLDNVSGINDLSISGKLGVAVPSPTKQLEVLGDAKVTGKLEVTGSADPLFVGDESGDPMFDIAGSLGNWDMVIGMGDVWGVEGSTLFQIDQIAEVFSFQNGSVGIGMTNPSSPLNVEMRANLKIEF